MSLSQASVHLESQRLGELLVASNIVKAEDLTQAIAICQETGLAIGRVLVMSGFAREDEVLAAIECQTLLREAKIEKEVATRALQLVNQAGGTLASAFERLGSSTKKDDSPSTKLGTLLVASGILTRSLLEVSLQRSASAGLPLGRFLVLSGLISEDLLMPALNAQVLVRDNRISLNEAVEALKAVREKQIPIEETLKERGFYQLPQRGSIRLGELLISAGIVSEADVRRAVEVGLVEQKKVGQVFLDEGIVSSTLLESALKVQQAVARDQMKLVDGIAVLSKINSSGMEYEKAIELVASYRNVSREPMGFSDFLTRSGLLTAEDINRALTPIKNDAQEMSKLLQSSSVLDARQVQGAHQCYELLNKGAMTFEHICVAFQLAKRNRISIFDALKELGWTQPEPPAMQQVKEAEPPAATASGVTSEDKLKALMQEIEKAISAANWEFVEQQAGTILTGPAAAAMQPLEITPWLEVAAQACFQQGKYAESAGHYSKAMSLKEYALGPDVLEVAYLVNDLAKVNYFQGKYDETEKLALRYVKIFQKLGLNDHPDLGCALHNLGTLYHIQAKHQRAEQSYTQALSICRKQLGTEHPATIRVLRDYARLLRETHREEEANHLDQCARGLISGSWKSVSIPPGSQLS